MRFELSSQVNNYIKELNRRIDEKSTKATEVYYDTVRSLSPVRTGRLKRSYEIHGDEIRNDTPYLHYVNDGTSKIVGQHFIERALEITRLILFNE